MTKRKVAFIHTSPATIGGDKMNDTILEQLCEAADSFYDRGYAFGSTGNLSVRVDDQVWITPTGQPLKGLTPARLAQVDLRGQTQNENRP